MSRKLRKLAKEDITEAEVGKRFRWPTMVGGGLQNGHEHMAVTSYPVLKCPACAELVRPLFMMMLGYYS